MSPLLMKQTTSCVLSKPEQESTRTSGIDVFTSGYFTLLYSGCVSVSISTKFKEIKTVHDWKHPSPSIDFLLLKGKDAILINKYH